MISRRFTRQAILAEVGPEGQARLAAVRAVVPAEGLAADVAARYLAGAGLVVAREPGASLPAPGLDLSGGPAEVASGALAALCAVRAALGVGQAGDTLLTAAAPQ